VLHHLVLFTWVDGTTDEQVEAVRGALAGLPAAIPEIRSYRFGADAGLADGNSAFGLVASFDDVTSYIAYRDHPQHQDVIARFVRPLVAQRTVIQFESDEMAPD
jgi:stress responsive alpha/beta barrel protein